MKLLQKMLGLLPFMLIAAGAHAAVIQTSGSLYDIDADGDLLVDDMKVGQVFFQVHTAGTVTIDLTTTNTFNSWMYLFDMAGPTLIAENDDESLSNRDSYIAIDLAPGQYMVGIGSILTLESEALQGYMQDFTFANNRYASSTASVGDWSLTVTTPVPVPPALLLFASALLGLVSVSRR